MHDFTLIDLAGLATVGWVIVMVLGPFARALARRLERSAPASAPDAEVTQLQAELDQLQERVDFLERVLASQQPPAELPRERTPV